MSVPLLTLTRLTPRAQGVIANKEDLLKVFGTTDEAKICVMARAQRRTQPSARYASQRTA